MIQENDKRAKAIQECREALEAYRDQPGISAYASTEDYFNDRGKRLVRLRAAWKAAKHPSQPDMIGE